MTLLLYRRFCVAAASLGMSSQVAVSALAQLQCYGLRKCTSFSHELCLVT